MKFKQLKIKNFFEIDENEVCIDFIGDRNGIVNIPYEIYEIVEQFFYHIPDYLIFNNHIPSEASEGHSFEPIEIMMIIEDDNGEEICYNSMFFRDNRFVSESLLVNNKLYFYYDTDDISIGTSFSQRRTSEDEDYLLDCYNFSKLYGFQKSIVFGFNHPVFLNLRDLFSNSLSRVNASNGYDYSPEKLIQQVSRYPSEVQGMVKILLLWAFPDIQDISNDWKTVKRSSVDLPIEFEGTGFRVLLALLPELTNCCIRDKCLVIYNPITGLHPLLKNNLFKEIGKKLGKNSQVILTANL